MSKSQQLHGALFLNLSFDHQYCYPSIQNHKLSIMECTKAVSCHTQFCEIWLFLSHPISLALAYKSCASLIQPWACMPHIPNVLPSFLGKNEKSFIGPWLFGYAVLDSAVHQINHYQVDKCQGIQLCYSVDRDLSSGYISPIHLLYNGGHFVN